MLSKRKPQPVNDWGFLVGTYYGRGLLRSVVAWEMMASARDFTVGMA